MKESDINCDKIREAVNHLGGDIINTLESSEMNTHEAFTTLCVLFRTLIKSLAVTLGREPDEDVKMFAEIVTEIDDDELEIITPMGEA